MERGKYRRNIAKAFHGFIKRRRDRVSRRRECKKEKSR